MPGIFISYRRNDVAGEVGRLFGRLADHYGEDFVFMDVESINPSQQFESVIHGRIKDCDVMLLAIGPKWVPERQHPDGTKDFVHMEIAEALSSKRAICPLMIDRPDALEASTLPQEFQDVLRSNAFDIRHRTFDRDVDALVAGLERLGIRPPPTLGRQRFEASLLAAGWPYSWFGAASRVLSPPGTLAALAVVLAAGGFLGYRSAFNRGQLAGTLDGRNEVTADYEVASAKERRESLRILGKVTNGLVGVDEASIALTNQSNHKSVTATSDTDGKYLVDLAELEIGEGDVVSMEVVKPGYLKTFQIVRYHDGFREFRVFLRK